MPIFDQTDPKAVGIVAAYNLEEASGARVSQTLTFPLSENGGSIGRAIVSSNGYGANIVGAKSLSTVISGALAPGAGSFSVFFTFKINSANASNITLLDVGGTMRLMWQNSSPNFTVQTYIFNGSASLVSEYWQNIASAGYLSEDTVYWGGIVVDRATEKVRFYRNGSFIQKDIPVGFGSLATSGTFFLNKDATASGDVIYDNVLAYNRALTTAEVTELYNGGDPYGYIVNTSSISIPVGSIPYRTSSVSLQVIGLNTGWTQLNQNFTISGVSGCTLNTVIINDANSATLLITTGNSTGTLTVTDNKNNRTATVEVIVDSSAVDDLPAKETTFRSAMGGAVFNGNVCSVGAQNGSNGLYLLFSTPFSIKAEGGPTAKFILGNAQSAPYTYTKIAIWEIVRNGAGVATGKAFKGYLTFSGSQSVTVLPGTWPISDPINIGTMTGKERWCFVGLLPRNAVGESAYIVDGSGFSDSSNDPDGVGKLFGVKSISTTDLSDEAAVFTGLSGGNDFIPSPALIRLENVDKSKFPFAVIAGDSKITQNGDAGGGYHKDVMNTGYANLAQNGHTLAAFTSASPTRLDRARQKMLAEADIIQNAYGANDVAGGATVASFIANIVTFKSLNPAAYFIQNTISPLTSSSEAIWTETTQVPRIVGGSIDGTARVGEINADIVSNYKTYGIDRILNLFEAQKSSTSNYWKVTGTTSTFLTGMSKDGVHEGDFGIYIARVLTYDMFNPVTNIISSSSTGGISAMGNTMRAIRGTVVSLSQTERTLITTGDGETRVINAIGGSVETCSGTSSTDASGIPTVITPDDGAVQVSFEKSGYIRAISLGAKAGVSTPIT